MKKEDLISGETILVSKTHNTSKVLYLGGIGLVHFVSMTNSYKESSCHYTIEELEELYTIEQPQSKSVPLEKKVYDFVPVRVKDSDNEDWRDFGCKLIAVIECKFPYVTVNADYKSIQLSRYCEFL